MKFEEALLRASFAFVEHADPPFEERFYSALFVRHPPARVLFDRARGERSRQRMITEALISVLDHLADAPWLERILTELGARHVGYGVTPEMFDWFTDVLIEVLADVAGSAWLPQFEHAWREALDAIVLLMLKGYQAAAPGGSLELAAGPPVGMSGPREG